jgi:hypothetical protein
MDWSFLQPVLTAVATTAVAVAVPVGTTLLYRYTGIKVSDSQEASIRTAATAEAAKMIQLGIPVTPNTAATAATKVLSDLPAEVKAQGYTPSDVADMVIGAAAIPFPAVGIAAPVLKAVTQGKL